MPAVILDRVERLRIRSGWLEGAARQDKQEKASFTCACGALKANIRRDLSAEGGRAVKPGTSRSTSFSNRSNQPSVINVVKENYYSPCLLEQLGGPKPAMEGASVPRAFRRGPSSAVELHAVRCEPFREQIPSEEEASGVELEEAGPRALPGVLPLRSCCPKSRYSHFSHDI